MCTASSPAYMDYVQDIHDLFADKIIDHQRLLRLHHLVGELFLDNDLYASMLCRAQMIGDKPYINYDHINYSN